MIGARKPEHAAGAAAEIHQPRTPRQPIGKTTRQCDTARRVIERFAQREPFGGEPLRHPVSASANSRTCIGQPGSPWPTCHAASAIA